MSLINSASLAVSSSLGFIGDAVGFFEGTGPGPAVPTASGFSNIFAFGDSLSDAGNDYIISLNLVPVSPPYVSGHFTNGPVWVQDLAATMGLPAVQASLSGGTDFAFGDAETGNDPLHQATPIDLPSQLQLFQILDPHPAANALYTISAGSNDVLDAISEFSTNQNTAVANLQAGVNNIEHFMAGLAAAGATNFLVANVPDIGKTPQERHNGHAVIASSLSKLFDQSLSQTLGVLAAQAHLNIHIVDSYKLVDQAVHHPHKFGLNNVKKPVWTGNYFDPHSGKLASTNPAVQNKHLFWDQLHPTAHAHSVLANAAHTALFS
jgi:phospholipase/lecithinase/hemolysin